MTLAIMQLRLHTLDRQIHRKNCRLNELQEQLNAMSIAYTNTSRLYKQLYLQINGIDNTVSEQMRQNLTNQLGDLEPVLQMINEKENGITVEIQEVKSELAQYNEEFKNVQKASENAAKKETAHYTMS